MIFKINVGFHREGDVEGYMAEIMNELTDSTTVGMKAKDLASWLAYAYDNIPEGYTEDDVVVQFSAE